MINRKSRLLVVNFPFVLAFKKKETGLYSLIGGNIEEHESSSEALIRETKEEAGIKISDEDFVFIATTNHQKKNVLHERNYFLLKNKNWNFKLKEVEKFDSIEWVDYYENKKLFKKSDQKIIKELFKEEL